MTPIRHFSFDLSVYSPRARAVLMFAVLGLLYTLITALVFPSNWEYLYIHADSLLSWPLSQPLELVPRLGTAVLMALLLLWLLRPGRRTMLEFAVGGCCLLAYAALVAYSYDLTGAVLVVPVVLRAWWSLRRTLLTCIPLILLGLGFNLGYLQGAFQPVDSNESLWQSVAYLVGQGVFAFIAFELTLRREEEQALLRRALGELRQYRDLELQHSVLEERTRVSRDLHDTLGHGLTALRLELQRARKVQADPDALTESLNRALDRSGEAMVSLQAAVKAIRPQALGTSLLGAVSDLILAWPQPVYLTLPSAEPQLSADARLAAFRCVQEGITNAQKHAPDQPLTLVLEMHPTQLSVTLRNSLALPSSGTGIPNSGTDSGLGLTGLREQVERAGGHLEAGPSQGLYRLQAILPLVQT